jgi:thiol:disulfide interchange protein
MKAITYLASFTIGASAIIGTAAATTLEGWSTDLDAALKQAAEQKKSVLVEFTGSDWCPPCIMMRKKVFSQKQFVEKASKNFILVELDFPNGEPEVKKKNEPLATKYNIEGFPTVLLLDASGKEFSRFYASQYPSIDGFLDHLKDQLKQEKKKD